MKFTWDEKKAASNLVKHGISFDTATEVFDDPNRVDVLDSRRNYGEERMMTIGKTEDGTLIVSVIHTDRAGVCRLISARPASRQERKKHYE